MLTDSLSVSIAKDTRPMRIERITDGELAILQVLWERGEATSREITAAIHDEVSDPKMASVQKLIERLEGKGCVERDRSERAHRFRPLVSREEYLRNRLESLADRLCEGSLGPLVTTLLRSERLPGHERESLRKLIHDLWPPETPGERTSDS